MQKVLLIFNTKDFEPKFFRFTKLSKDFELAKLFQEVLSESNEDIHKWIKRMWSEKLEVEGHFVKISKGRHTTNEIINIYGIGKSKKSNSQKENIKEISKHLKKLYSTT